MKTNTQPATPENDINLDCYVSPDELIPFMHATPEEIASEHGISLAQAGIVRTYARLKYSAMSYRIAGQINFALIYEAKCERIYKLMDENVKW